LEIALPYVTQRLSTTARSMHHASNRHCPKCQALARALWLEARKADLLPVPYFHVVFTMPEPIAAVALQNKRVVYDILFRSTAATLRTIAADPRHLGAEIGFVAVLHTWGQTLQHHPHLHCIVPGGGLAPDGQHWVACRPGFFLPVRVLSSLFRRLFLEALDQAFRAGELVFRGSLIDLNQAGRFAEQLQTARGIDCRVGGDVAAPTPHRPGRADFPHPVLHERDLPAAA